VETKRRLNNIIHCSGLIDSLVQLKARPASREELQLVHTSEYIQYVQVSATRWQSTSQDQHSYSWRQASLLASLTPVPTG
jgi:acetoin utilization deacetylase AcuC-like enzyme